jgi:hypothetical protein
VANKRALLERKEVLDTVHELLERFEAHLTAQSQFTVNTLHLHFSFIFCCLVVLVISETYFFWCIWNILVILVCSHCHDLCFVKFFMGGHGGGWGLYQRGTWCRQLTARCNVYMQWNVWWTKATKKIDLRN